MANARSRFALFVGNRGFFPASLLETARRELLEVLEGLGHEVIALDAAATRHGAVETAREGERYARFLADNRERFDGVILSLPNLGDENGAVAALRDAGVPILIHAYPDELDQMAPATRRDAFCGKFSVMDVFLPKRRPLHGAEAPHRPSTQRPLCRKRRHLRQDLPGGEGHAPAGGGGGGRAHHRLQDGPLR